MHPWPKKAQAICFAKYLHYWPDMEVVTILRHARDALHPKGQIYVIEMLLVDDHPCGGLLDMNMLAETGGQERTQEEWKALAHSVGFYIEDVHTLSPILSILQLSIH